MTKPADPMAAMLAKLWEKNLPVVRERVELLETAAAAAAAQKLSAEMRVQAHVAAHKLAGALGMYGRPEAGVVAGRIEEMLEGDGVVSGELVGLSGELKRLLFG